MSTIQQSILNKNRKDKFLLVLNLPDPLKKINIVSPSSRESDKVYLDSLQYSVYGTIVPAATILAANLPYSGQSLNVATGKRQNYQEVTVNFTVDNRFNNWWVLWKWLDFINNAKTSTFDNSDLVTQTKYQTSNGETFIANSAGSLQSYQTNITVYGLDEYNEKKIQWNFYKSFITSLNGITYNYRDPELIESSFTFSFSQLTAELL
jgi:hypothetical protein